MARPLITSLLVAAGLAGLAIGGRAPSITGTLLLTASVARSAGAPGLGAGRVAIRMLVGAAPAVVVVAAVADLAAVRPAPPIVGAVLTGTWTVASRTLGAATTRMIATPAQLRDVAFRLLAVASVTAFVAGAMVRLLTPSVPTVQRLSWILGEEDNAHVVGVGREVIASGPRGVELADQYGTAFMNLPLLLTQLFGGLPAAEQDPRFQAISAFTVSTLVVILLAGLAMGLLAALPDHVHGPPAGVSPDLRRSLLNAAGATTVATIGMSLLVVLPMRSGFLTFVWGLTFVLLGSAITAALPPDAGAAERSVVLLALTGLGVLLLSSWPFILPALAGLSLIPLSWVRWQLIRASVRHHPGRWGSGLTLTLTTLAVLGVAFSRWGPAAEVLSYGTNILTYSGSGISADDLLRRSVFVVVGVAVALLALGVRRGSWGHLAAVAGPVAGGLALYGALRAAALILTGGELNYSGVKLFYGVVVLSAVLGLTALLSEANRRRTAVSGAVVAMAAVLIVASPTASLITDWWSRTDLGAPPHAVAAVEMISQTTPNLPIRCLPAPGTAVTGSSRWAAYWCARWMEDAFNEGRFQGHRDELLGAETDTFAPIVEDILASSPSEYLFSARMTLGPGWFGWDGRS